MARVAPTQDALYADIDLALSWSERDLPERERTKHVHRLHPYLGKFIPQLVEVLLERYFRPGQHVLDPFAGSGTTLVQALESGLDATGVDVAAFNCLLMQVKTRAYNAFVVERELRAAHARVGELGRRTSGAGTRRRPRASCWAFAASSTTTSTRMCCASCWRAPPARRGALPTSISTSRASLSSSRTGATSTGASAGRSRRPLSSCAATRSTRLPG
ncbi:MAG: site-specific DNA-methyltransferase [Actinobacteria bacterium]|nr:MAG: site-specific DNA-methyltransferase [Actinomycetota bacterium]